MRGVVVVVAAAADAAVVAVVVVVLLLVVGIHKGSVAGLPWGPPVRPTRPAG